MKIEKNHWSKCSQHMTKCIPLQISSTGAVLYWDIGFDQTDPSAPYQNIKKTWETFTVDNGTNYKFYTGYYNNS